jgi:dTDP-4-dehydrorhamnose reductase
MADVLVLGATSMVGSHFVEHSGFSVHAAGRQDPNPIGIKASSFTFLNLDDLKRVDAIIKESTEPVVVNFAARTDVDGIEKERCATPVPEPPTNAWTVNTLAPEIMAKSAYTSGKFLITISTEAVFDGESGPYGEESERSPFSTKISWYGWTKSESERRILNSGVSTAIVRIVYPYRSNFPYKLDFARSWICRRKTNSLPPLYSDLPITPTWIPDVTKSIRAIIRHRATGIFHVASAEATTPYEFGEHLFRLLEGKDPKLAKGSVLDGSVHRGIAPRPWKAGLLCDRLPALGVEMTPWRKGIEILVDSLRGESRQWQ